MEDFRKFLGKSVLLTTNKGSKYAGVLNGVREKCGKLHLTELAILTKYGKYKAQSLHENGRWFNFTLIRLIEEEKEG